MKLACTVKLQNAWGIGGGNFMIFGARGKTGQYKILKKWVKQEPLNCGLIYFFQNDILISPSEIIVW